MAKQVVNQKYIYKVHSTKFRLNNWCLKLSFDEAMKNEEIVPIADSIVLRMIRKVNNIITSENDIFHIKKKIRALKLGENSMENRKKLEGAYNELYKAVLVDDYLAIVFDSISDWSRANSKKYPLFFNGKQYVRLVGTNGGVKKNVVIFCTKEIHDILDKKMNNDRNPEKEYIPAKFESYKALSCSASIPVSNPQGVLVIKDAETIFNAEVLQLIDNGKGGFSLNHNEKYKIIRSFTDGCGMISRKLSNRWAIDLGLKKKSSKAGKEKWIPEYTPSGFNIRNSWCKGMVFTFPFLKFAKEVAHSYFVEDVWGHSIDIRKVDLVITSNMLKLWDSYDSIENYLEACKNNDYSFSVAKVLPKELERTRNMNYQFLDSYELSDEDIKSLIKPTVDEIKASISDDYRKALLFMKGNKITEEDYIKDDMNYIKALMVEKELMHDSFIKQKLNYLRSKRIKDSKKGVLKVNGNYSIISGDLYGLCQYMFGMEVTGLLKADEFYSRAWNKISAGQGKAIDKVVAFRAPMSNHNNIRIFNLKQSKKLKEWFKYMPACIVFNAWDTTVDALNGADFDGDAVITTNNPVLLKNTRKLPAIVCEQQKAKKHTIKENLLRAANKNGFNNNVGGITNLCTRMYDILAVLDKNSEEYKELSYRIICMQGYQQEIIDSIKGIIPKKVPKSWYSSRELKIEPSDSLKIKEWKEKQIKLAGLKNPYFFIYNYDHEMKRYKKYIKDCNTNSLIRFGIMIDELEKKENKTADEINFLKYYYLKMPVSMANSTMNRICWELEKQYEKLNIKVNRDDFDKEILKAGVKYKASIKNKLLEVYKVYKNSVKQYMAANEELSKEEKKEKRGVLIDNFKRQVFQICSNEDIVCDILVDLLYSSNENKQFVWDICGETILKNLLKRNNNKLHYPVQADNGDFQWNGYKFKMVEKEVFDVEEEI